VTFPQVRKELSKPETILIDVREPAELGKEGRISQNAKNIPRKIPTPNLTALAFIVIYCSTFLFLNVVGQLEAAFQLSDAEFETKYGFPKPTEDQTIVTHCKLGIRATKGAMALSKAGFLNVLCVSKNQSHCSPPTPSLHGAFIN